MTEELKKEAEEKASVYFNSLDIDNGNVSDTPFSAYDVFVAYKKGALEFAEPREKRIAELEAQIEVTAKSKDLVINNQLEETNMLKEKIKQLEAQIEKMKCCENCAFQLVIGGVRDRHCVKCNACSEWELED